ncbi:unnamed protein product, partial [Prorocentrum cordatum]
MDHSQKHVAEAGRGHALMTTVRYLMGCTGWVSWLDAFALPALLDGSVPGWALVRGSTPPPLRAADALRAIRGLAAVTTSLSDGDALLSMVLLTEARHGALSCGEELAAASMKAETAQGSAGMAREVYAVELIKANSSAAKVEPAIMDVSVMASVRKFAAAFREKHDLLDILVANAGIAHSGPQARTIEGIEPIFATNHVGHQLLYTLLEDLIQSAADKKGDARVVAVSSGAHFEAKQGCAITEADLHALYDAEEPFKMGAYARSKLANVLFAREVAARNAQRHVFSNSVHPGVVHTEIWNKTNQDDREHGPIVQVFINIVEYFKESMWTSEEGALTQ